MVQEKKMNASLSAKILKDLTMQVELVRARQEEKQAILNEFDAEKKRFFFGKISEKALAHSVKKTNEELSRLDKNINIAISQGAHLADKARSLCTAQRPFKFRATMTGLAGGKESKKSAKKKVVRKKASKKKVSRRK